MSAIIVIVYNCSFIRFGSAIASPSSTFVRFSPDRVEHASCRRRIVPWRNCFFDLSGTQTQEVVEESISLKFKGIGDCYLF